MQALACQTFLYTTTEALINVEQLSRQGRQNGFTVHVRLPQLKIESITSTEWSSLATEPYDGAFFPESLCARTLKGWIESTVHIPFLTLRIFIGEMKLCDDCQVNQ